jgi:disulfide bond formation protein DsbB
MNIKNYFPPSPRHTNVLIVIACTGLIATALILQTMLALNPCPLCITQRVCVIVVGVIALIAAVHNPARTGVKIYALLQGLAAILGIAVAGRHVWIQSLPADQVPACGPGLKYMFANFPFMDALGLLFRGDGNCAVVDWTFLTLSIPAWVLISCALLLITNIWQLFRR